MRFRTTSIPWLLLLALPLLVAHFGLGVHTTVFLLLVWTALRQVIVRSDIVSRQSDKRVVLHSLSASHFVEKVRWSLERLGIEYEEEADVGIVGVVVLGRMVPGLTLTNKNMTLYNSADILRYLYGLYAHDQVKERFLRPSKEALELERKIDQFGLDMRRFLYFHLCVSSGPNGDAGLIRFWGIHQKNVPQWQKVALRCLFPLLKAYIIKVLNVNAAGAEDGLRKSRAFLAEVDGLLCDGRRFLLDTAEPTFVDVSLAALAGPMVLPEGFGGGGVDEETRFKVGDFGEEFRREVERVRGSPAGKFVIRMYEEMRW